MPINQGVPPGSPAILTAMKFDQALFSGRTPMAMCCIFDAAFTKQVGRDKKTEEWRTQPSVLNRPSLLKK
jgi:hypothetical protein